MNKSIQRFLAVLSLTVAIGMPANLFSALEDTAVTSILASVVHVDHETREILVIELEGLYETEPLETATWYYRNFSVSEDVAGFDYVRAGDRVVLEVAVSLALDLRKATKDELEDPVVIETVTTKKGNIEHVIAAVCEVVEIDKKANKVTFQGPKGQKFKVRVAAEHMRNIKKVGDTVVVTYTQSEVVGLSRAG